VVSDSSASKVKKLNWERKSNANKESTGENLINIRITGKDIMQDGK
jgi:hypothetical protein